MSFYNSDTTFMGNFIKRFHFGGVWEGGRKIKKKKDSKWLLHQTRLKASD